MFACRLCSNLGSKIVQTPKSLASMLKNIVSYPPLTHAFLKWPFLTDFKKYTHIPPYGMKFWCPGRKMEKTLKIHEFAARWHILNVPERYHFVAYVDFSSTHPIRTAPSIRASPKGCRGPSGLLPAGPHRGHEHMFPKARHVPASKRGSRRGPFSSGTPRALGVILTVAPRDARG